MIQNNVKPVVNKTARSSSVARGVVQSIRQLNSIHEFDLLLERSRDNKLDPQLQLNSSETLNSLTNSKTSFHKQKLKTKLKIKPNFSSLNQSSTYLESQIFESVTPDGSYTSPPLKP
jgi:hypothetical protein